MEPVRSPRNQRVAAAVRLRRARERKARGLTLLEGPNLLEAAIGGGASLEVLFALEDDEQTAGLVATTDLEVVTVTREVLERLAPSKHPRGPVGILRIPQFRQIGGRNALILYGVGDPGNAGTLIRSAAAFGFDVLFGPGSADPWNPKVLRSGAGAHFSVSIESGPADPHDLRNRGFTTVASIVSGATSASTIDSSGPCAVYVGDEANGLPVDIVEACNRTVTIPMDSALESLNASVAGSILMYVLSMGGDLGTPAPG
jgi:TrmH family RNA methyltransferase